MPGRDADCVGTGAAENSASHYRRQRGRSFDAARRNRHGHRGSDRTLGRTGEVANKIGTYTKAVLAKRHGIPFYVAIPLSTIDWRLRSGREIPIEERDESEVLGAWGALANPKSRIPRPQSDRREYLRVANPGSRARNPGFD